MPKMKCLKSTWDSLKTVAGKASALGFNEVLLGSYENLFNDLAKYEAVSLADLKRVAAKYLNPEQRNLVILNRFSAATGKNRR